jgi:cyclase
MHEIADGIIVETAHLGSNNAIISTDDGVVLIDAPHLPTDAVAWRATAEKLGSIEYLIHTDHHIDHSMGNYFLPGRIVGQRQTYDGLLNHFPDPQYVGDLIAILDPDAVPMMAGHSPRLPEVTFTDELDLHIGGRHLRLISLSGHTPNTIGVLLPDEGIFFSGDNVCTASLPSFQEAFVDRWLDTLDRIEQLDFDILVPGHGDIATKSFVDVFRGQMLDLIAEVDAVRLSGVSREETAAMVRYDDRIHGATKDWAVGYPDQIVESLQVRSIAQIFGQLEDGTLVNRGRDR